MYIIYISNALILIFYQVCGHNSFSGTYRTVFKALFFMVSLLHADFFFLSSLD